MGTHTDKAISIPREVSLDDFTAPLELAVVIPTFNEAENICALLHKLRCTLSGLAFEIIVVDDRSPDGTADHVREIAKTDLRVRCIERVGRRGLSGAALEGAMASAAPVVAVIDGDMQHDENLLPKMLNALRSDDLELVVASRYLEHEGFGDWPESRVRLSKWATALARRVAGVKLTDPMSGYFMIRADVLRTLASNLSVTGFKLLLDILLTSTRPIRHTELHYQFRERRAGRSKLDPRVMIDFVELLIDKMAGGVLPAKLVVFSLVGGLGVVVHLSALYVFFYRMGIDFSIGQTIATLLAMTSNFALNNILTYRDQQLSGWAWVKGLVMFALASSVGIFANVGVATYLFSSKDLNWVFSAAAGIAVGVVWNYATTKSLVWNQ